MGVSILERNNVHIVGNGEQPIIFAHGFGTDQTAWRHQIPVFSSNYRLILFDHIGAGKADLSAYSPRRYSSLYSYAEDLLDICDTLNLTDCILVGHSVSGMISLLAAITEPKRFKQLFFIGASPRYLNDFKYIGGFEQSDLDELYAAMSSNYYAWASGFAPLIMGNPNSPELAIEFARTLSEIRPDIAQAVAKVIFQSDHRRDLPQLTVPTVIIQGNNDRAVPPEVGQYMLEHIPNSDWINIPASGHLPHLSAPEVVSHAIASHLLN
ncbi:MAG: alpha/beta fold hydrolase [Chroococcales cyanobacterium]